MRTSPEDTWLVVVDMQVIFADPDSPWVSHGFETILAPVQRLIAGFTDRVAYTRFIAPEVVEGGWVDYYGVWPFALQPATAAAYQIVDTLPPGDAPVVSLATFGKWGPGLSRAVRGSRDLVLVGVSTDCCVLSTALAAADAGVRVRIAADGCRGVSELDHQRALDAMAMYAPLIEITDAATVLAKSLDERPNDGRRTALDC